MDRKIKKKKWTVKRSSIYSASGLLVVFIGYNFFLSGGGARLNVERNKINIATVHEGEFREFIPVDGNVLPIKTIRLDAIEGGVVSKKYYEGGILVEKGDTILALANNALLQNFGPLQFQQVILDYYWMPTVCIFMLCICFGSLVTNADHGPSFFVCRVGW